MKKFFYASILLLITFFVTACDKNRISESNENALEIAIAHAGIDESVTVSDLVTLDGNESTGTLNSILSYYWTISSKPAGSNAVLTNETTVNPTFVPDINGTYIIALQVNDGTTDSEIDTVTIRALNITLTHNGITYGTVTSPYTGKVWLDRNLGATQVCTSHDDANCYGGFYQWGRNTDGHETLNSSITYTTSDPASISDVGHGTFFAGRQDWANTLDENGSLREAQWSKTDGSSVCPIGFRVPTRIEGYNEFNNISADPYDSFLKLPDAGYRQYTHGVYFDQGGARHTSGHLHPIGAIRPVQSRSPMEDMSGTVQPVTLYAVFRINA